MLARNTRQLRSKADQMCQSAKTFTDGAELANHQTLGQDEQSQGVNVTEDKCFIFAFQPAAQKQDLEQNNADRDMIEHIVGLCKNDHRLYKQLLQSIA